VAGERLRADGEDKLHTRWEVRKIERLASRRRDPQRPAVVVDECYLGDFTRGTSRC
jgi:hypothetical protein